jgi:hypothetical protein
MRTFDETEMGQATDKGNDHDLTMGIEDKFVVTGGSK